MSDPITQKLDEMQALCDAATEGPWEAEGSQVWGIDSLVAAVLNHSVSERRPDAEFIAASRTDMPKLIDALKAALAFTLDEPCQCPDESDECHCPRGGHGLGECVECSAHELYRVIATALGVHDE